MSAREEHVEALFELLADGQWHDGPKALRETARKVPPGPAGRDGKKRVRDPGRYTDEELMAFGRRGIARELLSQQLSTGRLLTDVGKLAKRHWAGNEPWQVRDTQAGYRTIPEAADELDVTESVLRTWIKNGFIPHSTSNLGLRLSPKDFEIAQRVRAVWPGPRKTHWPVDPRTLWSDGTPTGQPTLVCPHCSGKLTVTLMEA